MTDTLPKGYRGGTHRLVAPEQTLARITPHLATVGVTRLADVTGLDGLGIPVYCAIRPAGTTLQVSNGKGLRHVDAKVSALMEAIELDHFEKPTGNVKRGSLRSMQRDGYDAIPPDLLPDYRMASFFSADYVIDWVRGEDLLSGQERWLPASAVYVCAPKLYDVTTNGLASGNHLLEATLHGLYEVIERDAVSRLSVGGRVRVSPERCRVIDPMTVRDGPIRELHDTLVRADVKLVLIWVKSCIPVHTFLAVILDPNPFSPSSMVNIGSGTHRSVSVAAVRAITEAAQSRLTFIHGSREDLRAEAYSKPHDKIYRFFDRLETDAGWEAFEETAEGDLLQDHSWILRRLSASGHTNVFRVDMTRRALGIPVVKVLVCGLEFNHNLF